MIQIRTIDRENIIYLVDQLETFEKDKAIKSGLRAAVNVFRVRGRSNLRSRLLHHGKPGENYHRKEKRKGGGISRTYAC